jgi:Response regulators consisting of a CheY-like receiver domain and a winged-helix DNA-binding domain
MTAIGPSAIARSRAFANAYTPPAREGRLGRVESVATAAAGLVRLAVVTRNDPLAAAIASLCAAAGAELTRCGAFDACSMPGRGSEPFDVMVLDYQSTADISRRIRLLRSQWPMCGIIVLNVGGVRECASLLDEGADDACTLSSHLVVERLHALMRRARTLNAGFRSAIGDVVVDREHRRVWCATREVPLSVKEFDVLLCLFDHSPKVVAKSALATIVWRGDSAPNRNTVEVYVGYVRRKLTSSRAVRIRTVRGVGYTLSRT